MATAETQTVYVAAASRRVGAADDIEYATPSTIEAVFVATATATR